MMTSRPQPPRETGQTFKKKKEKQSLLKRSIGLSVLVHLCLVVLLSVSFGIHVKNKTEEEKKQKKISKPISWKSQKKYIKVDVVALPKKTFLEKKKVDLTKEIGEVKKPKKIKPIEKVVKKDTKAKKIIIEDKEKIEAKKSELKLKEQKALEAKKLLVQQELEEQKKLKEEFEQKKILEEKRALLAQELEDQKKEELVKQQKEQSLLSTREKLMAELRGEVFNERRQEIAGNIKSDGLSHEGQVGKNVLNYQKKVEKHLLKHWTVPRWMNVSGLNAVVNVKISPDGRIIDREFIKESGDLRFDKEVRRAIKLANPLPPPPEKDREALLRYGVNWSFP